MCLKHQQPGSCGASQGLLVITETRIVVNNQGLLVPCHEREQDLSGEEKPGGDRAALFCEKEPHHSTVQVQKCVAGSGHGLQGGIEITKDT